MLVLFCVVILALFTGLITVFVELLLVTLHADALFSVQPVKLYVYPLKMESVPISSEVSVGMMYS